MYPGTTDTDYYKGAITGPHPSQEVKK